MHTFSRRQFLNTTLATAALAPLAVSDPLGMPIGCQLYPVREALSQDFEGTLAQLAAIGYRSVELCSPPGYEKSGFGTLVGRKASALQASFHAAGLKCESCHYQFRELKENLPERIAFAKELGLKQMILSTFGLKPDAARSEWAQAARELNKIGEQVRKSGMQLGFHNHHFEFKEIDGVLVYDKLMSEFDPDLVKMQFQVSVISLGYEAAAFFAKYQGRFISIHLQDWSSTEKKQMPIGQGIVDWKKLFTAAKATGVKNYFVEVDMAALKASYPYLHDLKV